MRYSKDLFIRDFYQGKETKIKKLKEKKFVNDYYKNNYSKFKSFEDFKNSDFTFKSFLEEYKNVEEEVKKQFLNKKSLQFGIINEIILLSSFAKKYNLTHTQSLKEDNNFFSLNIKENARYIYFNPENTSEYIVQYGDPNSVDAEFVTNNQIIKIEIKEPNSKAKEIDIPSYDDNGKLVLDERFIDLYPEYIDFIKWFNSSSSILENLGSNIKLNNNSQDKNNIVSNYFKQNSVDFVMTYSEENDDLILIKSEDFHKFISTDGSEIRTSGKNSKKIFTDLFFKNSVKDLEGIFIDKNILSIKKEKVVAAKARGKDTISRIKINYVFFSKIEDVREEGENIIFNLQKIKQLKPTISIHMFLLESYEKIKTYYLEEK
jgi:hypothetical protein